MMAFSLLAIVVLGFTVWAHHMFVSGMQDWIRIPMMITTAIIAIPTGIKIFSWLATMWRGVLHMDTPMLWAVGFLTMFTLGGISGVMLAMVPLVDPRQRHLLHRRPHPLRAVRRLAVHDLRRRLLLVPEDDGAHVRRAPGQLHFWLTFVFFNVTFAPMHLIGVQGMPRRVYDYADQFAGWNLAISLSSFVLGLSSLIFLYNIIASWRGGPRASANPWRALTLEWQVSSPPPIFNFDAVPSVVGGPVRVRRPGRRTRRLPGRGGPCRPGGAQAHGAVAVEDATADHERSRRH